MGWSHALLLLVSAAAWTEAHEALPNFVVIFTDDQDAVQNSTHKRYMPNVDAFLRQQGVEFANYFVTTPFETLGFIAAAQGIGSPHGRIQHSLSLNVLQVCCPSRTNLWRGQFSHNTKFTEVLGAQGGYAYWRALGIDKHWLPLWMQQLGYNTYYSGKFIVDYSVQNYQNVPAGFTDFDALVHPYTFDYTNPAYSHNGGEPQLYPGLYTTDVLASKAVAQLQMAAASGKPFFNWISAPAPHHSFIEFYNPNGTVNSSQTFPPVPAPRHWSLFSDATIPRPATGSNINEDDDSIKGKPQWIQDLPRKERGNMTYLEEVYRLRLRALAAVDDLVGQVFETLQRTGQLDNTYVIYTADNGYHVASHRFGGGKILPYEEDIRVPFFIRGPGITPGQVNYNVGLHVDIAPTILTLAGAGNQIPTDLDGTPLALADQDDGSGKLRCDYPRSKLHRNQFITEFWGTWDDEMLTDLQSYPNNTWKSIRVVDVATDQAWKYTLQCTGERELYDIAADPAELWNLHSSTNQTMLSRFEALLAVLAVCKADSCRQPWQVIHGSNADVSSFVDSLNAQYDSVYASVSPFRFNTCLPYLDDLNELSQFREAIAAAARNNTGDLGPVTPSSMALQTNEAVADSGSSSGHGSSSSSISEAGSSSSDEPGSILQLSYADMAVSARQAMERSWVPKEQSWLEKHAVAVPEHVYRGSSTKGLYYDHAAARRAAYSLA